MSIHAPVESDGIAALGPRPSRDLSAHWDGAIRPRSDLIAQYAMPTLLWSAPNLPIALRWLPTQHGEKW